MIVLGLGNDLVDIRRIERSLARWGTRFIARVFTEAEIARSESLANRAASYARRFAAKEACAKALGTGFAEGVFLRDIGVVNISGGRPVMALTGGAAGRLRSLTPDGMKARIDLSITDDPPYAQAIVIISAIPGDIHDRIFANG
ncbi:MAG: holo-ACP synthase [Rhodothalassiaceae bacterium]